jgi:hypothetical protein
MLWWICTWKEAFLKFLFPRTWFSNAHCSLCWRSVGVDFFSQKLEENWVDPKWGGWKTCKVKSSVSWDISPCSPLTVDRHFGATYRLHLQVRGVSQVRKHHKGGAVFCFHRTTRCYVAEDRILRSNPCEDLMSNVENDLRELKMERQMIVQNGHLR